ncbi:phage tail termination protein [Citrobacter koseri]
MINYVEQNDIADECLGLIQNLGNMPAPLLTEEGRLVFRLQFMCVYGE